MPQVEGARGGVAYGWRDGGLQRSNSLKGLIDPTKILTADLVDAKLFDNTGIISRVEF